MKNITILLLISLLISTNVKSQNYSFNITGGYTFTHAPLRDINEFIGLYNENPNKLQGYVFTHGFKELKSLRGIYFGAGMLLNGMQLELNYSRKFNHTFAYYDPAINPTYFRVDIGYGITTVEAAVLYPQHFGNVVVSPGIGMGFLSRKLYYWDDYTQMTAPKHKDMITEVKSGSLSLDPMIQVCYRPSDDIPVEIFCRAYYQAMFSKMSVGWLGNFEGYWAASDTASKKVTGGNLGVIFGVKINLGNFKRNKTDIYYPPDEVITELVKPLLLNGAVSDATTGLPINAVITMYEGTKPVESVVSKFGNFDLKPDFDKNYTIEVSAFGYQTKTEKIKIGKTDANPYKYSVKLEKIKIGQSVVLENILFEKASSVLLPESYPELDKLLIFLQDAPDVRIEIAGHTSSEGDDSYNMRLSQERAEAVVFYLTEKGIDKLRIVAKGYGETKPVESNDTEDGRKLNRRVEFKIVE